MNNKLRTQCAGAAVYTHALFVLNRPAGGLDGAAQLHDCQTGEGADELRENLGDLLCDLRHWAAAMGLDYDDCNSTGLMHYNAEIKHEQL